MFFEMAQKNWTKMFWLYWGWGWIWQKIIIRKIICDALSDLVPLVQFKKHEKHPWRNVTFSEVTSSFTSIPLKFWWFQGRIKGNEPATLLKVTLFYGCSSHFLNCTNGTKSRKTSHLFNRSAHIFATNSSEFSEWNFFILWNTLC